MSSADGAPAILDLGVLAGVVVVEDRMDGLAGGDLALDGVEETDELLMPMALHVAADYGSVEHVHRRKQRRRAIALVIMSHRSRPALLHRQARLGSVERLDLALLVDGKDNSVRRRIDIEPDHVAQLVNERGVFGELELPDAVWLKSVGAPDALHGRDADAGCLRHRCVRPMRRFGHRRLHRQRHDAFGDSGIKLRDARRPRLVGYCSPLGQVREALLVSTLWGCLRSLRARSAVSLADGREPTSTWRSLLRAAAWPPKLRRRERAYQHPLEPARAKSTSQWRKRELAGTRLIVSASGSTAQGVLCDYRRRDQPLSTIGRRRLEAELLILRHQPNALRQRASCRQHELLDCSRPVPARWLGKQNSVL